jgi:hypothetical protein
VAPNTFTATGAAPAVTSDAPAAVDAPPGAPESASLLHANVTGTGTSASDFSAEP